MLPGFDSKHLARKNLRTGVRGWRRDCNGCEEASNALRARLFFASRVKRGRLGFPSVTLTLLAYWGDTICSTWEAQCEIRPARKSRSWERKLTALDTQPEHLENDPSSFA